VSRKLRVLLAAPIAGDAPEGGAAWAVLQYALGLERLGHDVHLVEQIGTQSGSSEAYFHSVMDRFGIEGELLVEPRPMMNFDMVLNISGTLSLDAIATIPIRVYLDLDPAFNQLWHQSGIDIHLEGHTHFVTVGQAIGRDGCDVPTHKLDWIGTLPPVVLDHWQRADGIDNDAFTTVANFRSYGSIHHDGSHYGQKVHSLRGLVNLPQRARDRFILAMQVHPDDGKDLAALIEGGWEFADPAVVAGTPDEYHRFIQGSRAEIGIAKRGYVVSRCGWFSDRSACYLASGRPVVAQDTGFSRFVATGDGLLQFDDEDGAIAAVEQFRSDYARHARAARQLAEEFLDSDRVLTRLLDAVGA
jgi:hypothetical protein